jgi:hypothetical protein
MFDEAVVTIITILEFTFTCSYVFLVVCALAYESPYLGFAYGFYTYSLFSFVLNVVYPTLSISTYIDSKCLHIKFIIIVFPGTQIYVSSHFCKLYFHVLMQSFIKVN